MGNSKVTFGGYSCGYFWQMWRSDGIVFHHDYFSKLLHAPFFFLRISRFMFFQTRLMRISVQLPISYSKLRFHRQPLYKCDIILNLTLRSKSQAIFEFSKFMYLDIVND